LREPRCDELGTPGEHAGEHNRTLAAAIWSSGQRPNRINALGARVQRLGRDVGIVGPDDRAGLGIGAELAEVLEIAQRLEDNTAVVEEVGKVDLAEGAVIKRTRTS
jgi:hypothetical protein